MTKSGFQQQNPEANLNYNNNVCGYELIIHLNNVKRFINKHAPFCQSNVLLWFSVEQLWKHNK